MIFEFMIYIKIKNSTGCDDLRARHLVPSPSTYFWLCDFEIPFDSENSGKLCGKG